MLKNVLDILFPPKCGFCGKINKNYLCKKCEIKLEYLKKDKIIKTKNKNYSHLLYGFEYKDDIRNKILNYKFNDMPELCNTFVKLLLNNKKICRFLESYDIIIPVPMYKKKQAIRGYNQTTLVAEKLAKNLHLEYAEELIKSRNTQMQSSLDAIERKNNIIDAYRCRDEQKIYGKKVILFDDIYTTGSTAEECAKQLKLAKDIAVFTIAKD